MSSAAFYDVMVLAVLALLPGVGGLVLWTSVRHVMLSRRLRHTERRERVLLPLLCAAVNDPARRAGLADELHESDREVVLPMLLQLALDLRGEELFTLAKLAMDLDVVAAERVRLRSRRSTLRIDAIRNLGLLRARTALPELLHVMQTDSRPAVRSAGAWAVGEIGGRQGVLGLLSMLEDPNAGVVRAAQEVVLHTARDAASQIVSYARRSEDPRARRAAVELLGALRDPVASELLEELVDDPDPELRTKVIKAAAAIADPRFLRTFRRLLGDTAWSVRCQAATGLGAIGATEAIPDLREALRDEAWWVRFNAATALAELGPPGRAALAEATTAEDAARRDVARYVLLRTGLERLAA